MSTIDLMRDWLGDGSAVHPMVAEYRAQYCLKCPKNVEGGWWHRNVTSPIAEVIRGQLEIKTNMNLHAKNESGLGMCKICGCALPLKVWVPTEHLRNHTSKELISKFPEEGCWITKELCRISAMPQK